MIFCLVRACVRACVLVCLCECVCVLAGRVGGQGCRHGLLGAGLGAARKSRPLSASHVPLISFQTHGSHRPLIAVTHRGP